MHYQGRFLCLWLFSIYTYNVHNPIRDCVKKKCTFYYRQVYHSGHILRFVRPIRSFYPCFTNQLAGSIAISILELRHIVQKSDLQSPISERHSLQLRLFMGVFVWRKSMLSLCINHICGLHIEIRFKGHTWNQYNVGLSMLICCTGSRLI